MSSHLSKIYSSPAAKIYKTLCCSLLVVDVVWVFSLWWWKFGFFRVEFFPLWLAYWDRWFRFVLFDRVERDSFWWLRIEFLKNLSRMCRYQSSNQNSLCILGLLNVAVFIELNWFTPWFGLRDINRLRFGYIDFKLSKLYWCFYRWRYFPFYARCQEMTSNWIQHELL